MTINGGTSRPAWNGESCPPIHAATHTRTGLKGQDMENKALPPIRGSNQSTDTKVATLLIDDAMTFIESGQVQKGVDLLNRALTYLPDVGLDRQTESVNKWLEKNGWQGVL